MESCILTPLFFMEKEFPNLRNSYFIGAIDTIKNIDSIYHSKSELYNKFYGACSKQQRKVLLNNIDIGLKLDASFHIFFRNSINSNEHPKFIPIIRGDFFSQRTILKDLKIDSLFLYVEGPCLNNCIFCKHKEDKFSDIFKLEFKLKENLKLRAKKVCIIGNEPLLHYDILKIITLAKKYGFKKIEIMTSGERLCEDDFCREIIKAGVSSFSLPLFAYEERIHDFIVGRKGSFASVIKGIRNALSNKAKIFVHTNIVKQNISFICRLERFVKKELGLPFVILPIRPKTVNLPFRDIMPSYSEIIAKIKNTNSLLGFPLCVVKNIQKNLLKTEEDISDSMKLYLLDQRFYKLKICKGCFCFDKCLGIFKEYYDIYPLDEAIPFKN